MNRRAGSANLSTPAWGGAADSMPLLLTKLHRPWTGPGLEHRTRLVEHLDRNVGRPLTLISAPAGYGKTMLASMWLQSRDSRSAWLSLDENDDDPITFATYLVAAIAGAFPELSFKTEALLNAATTPSAATIARFLVDDLQPIADRFVLALDDIHVVKQQAIFDLLGELLRHPLPSMHLLLIGRRDPPLPIASLRARGQVTEVRARDLQFTPSETAHLLEQILDHDVDEATAVEWTEKTEGWVAALRLAALSLYHRRETNALELSMTGGTRYLQEYLLADVLAHLPPAKKEWLLRTSLLNRFSAPLCEAACQSDGAGYGLTGKEFVRWLQDDNLFLVSLDDQNQWFRFHYLFRSLLQEELAHDEIADVRRRASAWCADNGLLDEAIEYALSAEDTATVKRLLVQHRFDLMNTEQWRRLDRWLKLLPADLVAQSPLLLSAKGFLALQRGDTREAFAIQQQAALLLAALPPESEEAQVAQAELSVLRNLRDFHVRQVAIAVQNMVRSLELLPPQALYVRAVAISNIAVGLQLEGKVEQSTQFIGEALADPGWPGNARAILLNSLCTALWMQGDLKGVLGSAEECLRVAKQFRLPELLNLGRYHLGAASYLRNEWTQAEVHLLALLEDRALVDPNYLAFGAFALALIRLGQGRGTQADDVVDTIGAYLLEAGHKSAHTLVRYFRAELAIRRGHVAEARRLSNSSSPEGLPHRLLYFYALQLIRPKVLLAERTPTSLEEARAWLEAMDAETVKLHLDYMRIDLLALLALDQDALGQESVAFETISRALNLAEPGGFLRNFVDLGPPMAELLARLHGREAAYAVKSPFLDQVLSAFPSLAQASAPPGDSSGTPAAAPQPGNAARSGAPGALASSPAWVEPLTGRESEIMRLLATDLSPEDIAGQMFVSVTTVRTHIRNIYAKLGVHSRFEAVQRAQQLGLLLI